jgi:hypothetical protein
MSSKKIAPSKELEQGQGLKVRGFVCGYKSGAGVDGEGVITIHAGTTYNGTNIFNISVSHKMAMELIGQDVDIIIVPTGARFPDDT